MPQAFLPSHEAMPAREKGKRPFGILSKPRFPQLIHRAIFTTAIKKQHLYIALGLILE